MKLFSWFLIHFFNFRNKIKQTVSFQTPIETLLQDIYLISNPLEDIVNSKSCRRNQVKHLIVNLYLILEVLMMIYWIIRPVDDPISLMTGSYFAALGVTGKMVYLAIICQTVSTVINRFFFYLAETTNSLDFLLDPLDYISRDDNSNPHLKKLKDMANRTKEINIERFNQNLAANMFVTITCILCVKKYGTEYIGSYILGWLLHAVQAWFFMNGNILTGHVWKVSLAFLEMRLLMIRDKINENNPDFTLILQELDSYQRQLLRFDRFLRGFLLASFTTCTPLFCTMFYNMFYGKFTEGGSLLPVLIGSLIPILLIENLTPMSRVANIWYLSMTLHPLLIKSVVKARDSITLEEKMKVLKWMKALTDDDHPLSPITITGEPLTPNCFFHYVMGIILNFLMTIDFLRE